MSNFARHPITCLLVFFFISVTTTACDSGSGLMPALASPANTVSDTPTSVPTPINSGSLTGTLVYYTREGLLRYNLATGEVTNSPNDDWDNQYDYSDARFLARPKAYSRGIVALTVNNCARRKPVCIAIQDISGNYISAFSLEWDKVPVPAVPSPDEAHVAMFIEDGNEESWLYIYNLQGDVLNSRRHPARHFSWTPDGRLVFVNKNRDGIDITKPYSTETEFEFKYPDIGSKSYLTAATVDHTGFKVTYLRWDWDDEYFAFDGQQGEYFSKLIVTDLTNSSTRVVAEPYEHGPEALLLIPEWSFDGNWLLVHQSQGVSFFNDRGLNYVIDANSQDAVKINRKSNKRSPSVLRLVNRNFYVDGQIYPTFSWPITRITWLP